VVSFAPAKTIYPGHFRRWRDALPYSFFVYVSIEEDSKDDLSRQQMPKSCSCLMPSVMSFKAWFRLALESSLLLFLYSYVCFCRIAHFPCISQPKSSRLSPITLKGDASFTMRVIWSEELWDSPISGSTTLNAFEYTCASSALKTQQRMKQSQNEQK
jgi:hypothetical protein